MKLTKKQVEHALQEIATVKMVSPFLFSMLDLPDTLFKEVLAGDLFYFKFQDKYLKGYSHLGYSVIILDSNMTQCVCWGRESDKLLAHLGVSKYRGFPLNGDFDVVIKKAFNETLNSLNINSAKDIPSGIRKIVAYRHDIPFTDEFHKRLTTCIQDWIDLKRGE